MSKHKFAIVVERGALPVKLYNTRLLVSDFKTSFLFYRDVLGLTPKFGEEQDVYAEFETGGAPLALFRRDLMADSIGATPPSETVAGPDQVVLTFAVENADEAYRQLQARGIEFVAAPQDRPDWGIRTAHFRDPDGHLLEIYNDLPK